eukprot:8262236-Lingulodinium_polyedra.AAC.1
MESGGGEGSASERDEEDFGAFPEIHSASARVRGFEKHEDEERLEAAIGEPQGNQVFCQLNECFPEGATAMRASIEEA